MSTSMRNWIGPTVCSQLKIALQSKGQNGKDFVSYDQDGTLKIRITESKRIQLNEFINSSSPYIAWVSDSYTKIRAVFSKASTEGLQKKQRRHFSQGSAGSVLGITEYYLTFNPNAPVSQKVMLKIEAFTLQGCEGSGNFGRPVLVEETSDVKTILTQSAINSRNGIDESSDSQPLSPIRSQEGISTEEMSSPEPATQADFATQAPKKVSSGTNVRPQGGSEPSRRALLGLIQENPPRAQQGVFADHEHPRVYVSPYKQIQHPYDRPTDVSPSFVSLLPTPDGHNLVSPPSAVVPLASAMTSSTTSANLENDIAHSGATPALTNPKIQKPRVEDVDIYGGIQSKPKLQHSNRKTEKISKTREQNKKSVRNKKAMSPARPAKDVIHEQIHNSDNPWQGLSRIPRNYVRIPKDQRNLLERDDSWYPPVCGSGQPSVSVPPNVLLALQAFHNKAEDGESDAHSDCYSDSHIDRTELEPDREKDVAHNEEPQLQLDEVSPQFNASLIPARNPTHSLQDLDDEGSVEEAISWASSSDRGDPLYDQLTSVIEHRPDAPNISPLQALRSESPPLSSLNAESTSGRRDESDQEGPSLSGSQNLPEHCPKTAVRRMFGNPKNGSKSSSISFSSSPVEMELSIPYALDAQNEASIDFVMTDAIGVMQTMGSLEEQPRSTFEVERTLPVGSKAGSTLPKNLNIGVDEQSGLRQQADHFSSDSIIPGTHRSETFNIPNRQATSSQIADLSGMGGHRSDADIGHESPVARQQSQLADNGDLPPQLIIPSPFLSDPSPSLSSVPGTQMSYSDSPLPPKAQIVADAISSPLTMPVKRTLSRTGDGFELFPKRRRPHPALSPRNGQQQDPGELAKANKRKFLQGLSLEHIASSPNSDQLGPLSAQSMASKTEIVLVSKDPVKVAPLQRGIVQSSPAGLILCELETAALNIETTTLEDHQYLLLDESKDHEETTRNAFCKLGTDGKNFQIESNESDKGIPLQVSIPADAGSQENQQDRLSKASTQLHPENNYEPRTETIYDTFTTAYPTYTGSARAFVRACSNLETLRSKKKAPHPSLWDDFIRAFDAEYMNHVKEKGERDAIKAVDFYNNHVHEPVFMKRIVSPSRLQEALQLDREYLESLPGKRVSQLSQESIQTINSDGSPEGQNSAVGPNIVPPSFGQVPKPSAATPQVLLDNVAEFGKIWIDHSDATLVPRRSTVNRIPFFETPSQVVSQNHQNATEPSKFGAPPLLQARKDIAIERSTSRADTPDIEFTRAGIPKQNVRCLPWPSSSQDLPEQKELRGANQPFGDLLEVNRVMPEHYKTGNHSQSKRQPSERSLEPREGSPILGSLTSNTGFDAETLIQSESFAVSSKKVLHQNPLFKTPMLPLSHSLGRRAASMPGQGSKDVFHSPYHGQKPQSLRAITTQNQIKASTTATFKDFAKAFVPRQRRQSSILSRGSTPGSNPSPTGREESETARFAAQADPDTQVWRF